MEILGTVAARDVGEGQLVQLRRPPYHLLVTRIDGRCYALEDACPHSGRSLCEGWLRGHRLVCAGHGWEIDVRTGEVLTRAGAGSRAPVFEVREERGELHVLARSRLLGVEQEPVE